jgi:polysaccharide export outer membrane protein
MRAVRSSFFLVIGCVLAFSGCAGTRSQNISSMDTSVIQADYASRNADRLNKALLNSKMIKGLEAISDYQIGPEDALDIEVFDVEELKKSVRVNYQGYIALPLVGQINVKGLTPKQVEKELGKRLEKYLQHPLVTVHVKEYKSQKIGVMGAVSKPEVYSVVGQKYLIDMLFMAGGLKDAGKGCYVFRPVNAANEEVSETQTIVIDLHELLEKGDRSLNIPVYSGDIINVPPGGVIFVDGSVRTRGMYRMQSKTTLLQALAMAGGLAFVADNGDIKVLRDTGEGTRKVIDVSYEKAKLDTKDDILIQDNDIIIVGRSALKTVVYAFGNLLTGSIGLGSGVTPTVGMGRTTATGVNPAAW